MNVKRFGGILAWCLAVALVCPAVAAEKPATTKKASDKSAEKTKAKSDVKLAGFTLDESYPEGVAIPGALGDRMPNMGKLIERIDQAAGDDKLFGIVLRLNEPTLGRGKVDELRAAIARARKGGKKVYALVQETTGAGYLLATACDEIVMPPSGSLTVSGVRMEVTFYKGLLEKLGIQADMLQVGDYKGAAEPMTRDKMSPEFRKQMESVIDDFYSQLATTVAEDRKLDVSKVKELIDEGLFTAQRAKEVGLIDRVAYEDELCKQLADQNKVDDVTLDDEYGKKKLDEDFSGFGGLMKMIEVLSGAEDRSKTSNAKKIAVIYAVGVITSGEGGRSMYGKSVGSDTIIEALQEAEEDPKVMGIVLRVDSPGGSALASDLMWREITRIKSKKPIVASMGDIAASGGYYISMGCSKIFAEPGTLTGSIGVVSGKVALKGLYDKIGVTTDVVSRGRNSGWMSSDEPYTASEREVITRLMHDIYKQFTDKAALGRNMDVKDLEGLAGGRLYTGCMAKQVKLVDELGTLDEAVADAKRLAGLKEDEKVERLNLPKPKTFLEQLMGGSMAESSMKSLVPELMQPMEQAQLLRRLFAEPTVLVTPYSVQVR